MKQYLAPIFSMILFLELYFWVGFPIIHYLMLCIAIFQIIFIQFMKRLAKKIPKFKTKQNRINI